MLFSDVADFIHIIITKDMVFFVHGTVFILSGSVLPDYLMINDAVTLLNPIFITPSDFVVQCAVGEMISPDKVAKFTWWVIWARIQGPWRSCISGTVSKTPEMGICVGIEWFTS